MLGALVPHLILGDAGVDRLLLQLPARRRLGAVAYAHYVHATELRNGLIVYPLLGIGGPLCCWARLALCTPAANARLGYPPPGRRSSTLHAACFHDNSL